MRYGPWLPDLPALNNPGVITANGVYPITNGFGPFPGPSVITNALTGPGLGSITFRRTDGVIETFCGDATKLYRLGGTTFADVSNGTYAASKWRFAVFGTIVIATDNVGTVQQFDVSSDSAFSDLSAAPVHSFPFVLRDFLVAADVNDGGIFQLKWSARNNSAKWTADCGGGAQQFPDGGPLVGATGGEQGVIFQENALTRMVFVGGDLRFIFDKVEGANGCLSSGSIVEHKGFTYYLSESGFQVFNGAQSQNISEGKVSDTFFANLDRSKIATLQGVLDLPNKSIVWAYATSSASAGENDKLIILHLPTGNWSEADLVTQTLLEDEISPNLLGNDAGPELGPLSGVYTYYDKKLIADLNLSIGNAISFGGLAKSTLGNATNQRFLVEFWTSGDSSISSHTSTNVQSSTYVRTILENLTIPATTAKITFRTSNSTNPDNDIFVKEAILNLGSTVRDFAASDGKKLAAFDTDNKLVRYSGSNIAAQIITGETQKFPGRKSRTRGVTIDTDATHTCKLSHRKKQQASLTTSSAASPNSSGQCRIRTNDRYHRSQLDIAAAASWTYANGVDVEAVPGGRIN